MDAVIEVEHLSKTFRPPFRLKKVRAVVDVSFRVMRGEVFGFLGPNGAGKTTTIKVLTGLIKPTSGKVRVLSGDPHSIEVRRRIGFLPEQPYFYDYLTPVELLDIFGRLFGLEKGERRRRIHELLDMVGLSHAKDRTLRKFSKGMLQRVGLAQALLNDPDLLILDEPMSGLDPIGRKEFSDLIASLKGRGKTIFFSSHILADIERLCDRVVILDKGVMKAEGDLQSLLAGGRWQKEIVVQSDTPINEATPPEVEAVERLDAKTMRLIVDGALCEAVLKKVVEAGWRVVSVGDRRMSLESLIMSLAKGEISSMISQS